MFGNIGRAVLQSVIHHDRTTPHTESASLRGECGSERKRIGPTRQTNQYERRLSALDTDLLAQLSNLLSTRRALQIPQQNAPQG